MTAKTLTPAQLHLLKLFSFDDSDEFVHEIQEVLTQHFQKKLEAETCRLWEEGIFSDEILDKMIEEDWHSPEFQERLLAQRPRSKNYQELLRRLSDFQEYEEGWDDADALPLNRCVVKNFKKVLEQSSDSILEGWTIFPAANGTLLLEYKPAEAGINIGKDDFSYYCLKSNGSVEGKNHQLFTPAAILNTMKLISHD